MKSHQNAVVDLVDLSTTLTSDEKNNINLSAELRVTFSTVTDNEIEISVSFNNLTLHVELDGLELEPGTRFGEPVITSQTLTLDREKTTNIEGRAKVGTDISLKERSTASFGLSADASQARKTTEKSSSEHKHFLVRAKPNNNWTISNFDNSSLDGTYLNNDVLVRCKTKSNTNRSAATTTVYCKQKDVILKQTGCFLSKNQSRLLKIFTAKTLNHNSSLRDGKLLLSESEVFLNGPTDNTDIGN